MGTIGVLQIRYPVFSVPLGDGEVEEGGIAVTESGPILLGSL